MSEATHGRAHDHVPVATDAAGQGVPGKMPVTARLSGRSQIVFRVESAEAARELAGALGSRDGNGVAAGSDEAVERAASSAGQALPGDLRDRFEGSLGSDLSDVRVHTGDASALAAHAVGAKAYTVGQDIHFGAGHYDPSSAFGLHLIAHEVAHTVQQQGATPTRQNQLEVSTPHSGAEQDADRAADAMIAGQPFQVSTIGASLQREQDAGVEDEPDASHAADQEWGIKPQESDVWSKPGASWEPLATPVAPAAGPPPVFGGSCYSFPPVMKWLDNSGNPALKLKPELIERRNRAVAAFTTNNEAVGMSYQAMEPLITAYEDSNSEIAKDDSLLGLLQFDKGTPAAGAPGANLANTTAGQKLGPENSQTSLGDLFHGKDGKDTDDVQVSSGPLANKEIKHAYQNVNAKQLGLKGAKEEAGTAVLGLEAATHGFDAATTNVTLTEAITDENKKKEELKKVDEDKARWKKRLDQLKSLVSITVKATKAFKGDPHAIADMANELVNYYGKEIVDLAYEGEISKLKSEIASLETDVLTYRERYAISSILGATAALKAAIATVDTKTEQVKKAYLEYQIAYDDFAAVVGKAATAKGGAKQGAKVQAALEAVPRIQTLLSRIAQIPPVCNAPRYTDDSGIGWTAAGSPADFPKAVGVIAGYRAKFDGEYKTWDARLKSLNALVSSIMGK